MATKTTFFTTRTGGAKIGSGVRRFDLNPPQLTFSYTAPSYINSGSVASEGHRGPPYKTGGPFALIRTSHTQRLSSTFKSSVHSAVYQRASTQFAVASPYIPPTWPSPLSTAALGPEGWDRAIPLSPIANLGNALFELKDLPALLIQTRAFFLRLAQARTRLSRAGTTVGDALHGSGSVKNSPSDYLGLQFGWLPMLNDLWSYITYQKELAKKLAWIRANNGKSVRRRISLRSGSYSKFVTQSVGPAASSDLYPILDSGYFYAGSSWKSERYVSMEYERKAWFSGKFSFYVPELVNPGSDLTSLKLDLLGLRLSARSIYAAVPWSWLISWFTNIGRIVSLSSKMARYHVVCRYGYVMQTETYAYHTTAAQFMMPGLYLKQADVQPPAKMVTFTASHTAKREFKTRVEATPYGFGLSDSAFSAYQWSILAALGLSRLR